MKKIGEITDEFAWGFTSSVSGKHLHSVSRHSRREKKTSCTVTCHDKISGMVETYKIPEGHYSKKEMQKLRNDAVDILIEKLLKKRKSGGI